ncbi:protein-PII uridylyltransferase [Moritella marina ATCC 15381]|uniref:Protein-PII uridylyltransferase n=1 Tax=Moritella marina ATCC 15381 TaxID=1202962 RepID=A0A5J6WHI8_MORMI|nr:hypothetical protein [Moritella marina]QFI37579.1 protein-PII uridylyltransferase [Moritella marina ATCC 15381]
MPINYLYIDDDETSSVAHYISAIESHSGGELKITHVRVSSMSSIKNQFIEGAFDGFIIDQKLDASNDEGETVDFYGTALAQNLRTEMIVADVPPSPIVLLSNEEPFVKYYDADESSHNLFDYTVKKKDIRNKSIAKNMCLTLIALVEAYKTVIDLPSNGTTEDTFAILKPVLGWTEQEAEYVDTRFKSELLDTRKDVHTFVAILFSSFIRSAGTLVTEEMLATKLGIDISSSSDWNALKDLFEEYKYKGLFSELKDRWWFSDIEDWWYDNNEDGRVLQALTCNERVSVIKNATTFEHLSSLIGSYENQSLNFWVNCIVTGKPLDPYDALRANDSKLKNWEAPIYLDLVAVLSRQASKVGYKVHPEDQAKIKLLTARLNPDVK